MQKKLTKFIMFFAIASFAIGCHTTIREPFEQCRQGKITVMELLTNQYVKEKFIKEYDSSRYKNVLERSKFTSPLVYDSVRNMYRFYTWLEPYNTKDEVRFRYFIDNDSIACNMSVKGFEVANHCAYPDVTDLYDLSEKQDVKKLEKEFDKQDFSNMPDNPSFLYVYGLVAKHGTEKSKSDKELAKKLWRRAIELNYSPAACELVNLIMSESHDKGIPFSKDTLLKYAEIATAEFKDEFKFAMMNNKTIKDLQYARKWLEQGAEHDMSAMLAAAVLDIDNNRTEHIKKIEQLCDLGSNNAKDTYITAGLNDSVADFIDVKRFLRYVTELADKGDTEMQYLASYCYGLKIEHWPYHYPNKIFAIENNEKEAVKYCKYAADANDLMAVRTMLDYCYRTSNPLVYRYLDQIHDMDDWGSWYFYYERLKKQY